MLTPAVDPSSERKKPHNSHWGAFTAWHEGGELRVRPHPGDPDPNPLLNNFTNALAHPARVARPMVRAGWLENGPGPDDRRGRDEYVELDWPDALALLGRELARVRDRHGPQSIYGGSYGWASAGRFHHAQSQLHRFLNVVMGGYVAKVNDYSSGAALVVLPHVIGSYNDATVHNVTWEQIVEHTEVLVAFGGMAPKNSQVASGGISQHADRPAMIAARAHRTQFKLISPQRDDLPGELEADWLAIRPGTDVALMLGVAHQLVSENLHDRRFLASHCVGWRQFEEYLRGNSDGLPKDPQWAARITGIDAGMIVSLARSLAGRRVLIVVAHALQRAEHGEQPVWMAVVLAAMLGQIGLPGGGFNYALGAIASYGRVPRAVPLQALPQGVNPVKDFIPVARVADMLLDPGGPYNYDGQRRTYPDIKLVYWAGGNPFHHHQDLQRLTRAFSRPDTVVVHEIAWTATARHADIVLPCTMTLERADISATQYDPLMIAMHPVARPFGQARDDYWIFSELAQRLGRKEAFTENRTVEQWLRHMYEPTRAGLAARGLPAPDFDAFWECGEVALPPLPDDGGKLRKFRLGPANNPLATQSGKIEIFSEAIDSFGYPDCPGHPAWLEPTERPTDTCPLQLMASQPRSKLHSQLDYGAHSVDGKRSGREVVQIHPEDAESRTIRDGDIVRVFNQRGACLASARLTTSLRPGVIQLPTGAWYDPIEEPGRPALCVHGNPNTLTRDVGTSQLAQGCCGQLTCVQVERFFGELPPVRAHTPPQPVRRMGGGSARRQGK